MHAPWPQMCHAVAHPFRKAVAVGRRGRGNGCCAQLGAGWLIDELTSSDDAERSKPDPDIIRAALHRAGAAPGDALMLGDTPYVIDAARKIGVGTIAARCGGWTDGDLAGAVAIYDDPADLLAGYDLSPLSSASPRLADAKREQRRPEL